MAAVNLYSVTNVVDVTLEPPRGPQSAGEPKALVEGKERHRSCWALRWALAPTRSPPSAISHFDLHHVNLLNMRVAALLLCALVAAEGLTASPVRAQGCATIKDLIELNSGLYSYMSDAYPSERRGEEAALPVVGLAAAVPCSQADPARYLLLLQREKSKVGERGITRSTNKWHAPGHPPPPAPPPGCLAAACGASAGTAAAGLTIQQQQPSCRTMRGCSAVWGAGTRPAGPPLQPASHP